MGVIKGIYNVAKKFINAIKNTIKKIGNFIKFIITPIGGIVGWILLFIFIGILLYALIKTGARAIDNLFGEDWNYSTFEEDLSVIKDLYDSGYESVIDAENFQDFKAFEYAVLMDAAEYLRLNEIDIVGVSCETDQNKLDEDQLDAAVQDGGGGARSIYVEDYGDISADNKSGNNTRVTRPILVYEFKPTTLSGDSLDSEEYEVKTREQLLQEGLLDGSLEPYVYIIRDDIEFSYYFYDYNSSVVGATWRVFEYSMDLNAYNSELSLGVEVSKSMARIYENSSILLDPYQTYGTQPYYSDVTKNAIYKIPLSTLLGRYLPKAELLQAWMILKQDIDEPEEDKTDIVDELLASIKGVYNEACIGSESGKKTIPKTIEDENGEEKEYKYSGLEAPTSPESNKKSFVSFLTCGIESTQYGISGFSTDFNGDTFKVVVDFVPAVLIEGDTVTVRLQIVYEDGSPIVEEEYISLSELGVKYGSYLPAGEPVEEGKYSPPTSVTQLEEGYYVEGTKDSNNKISADEILSQIKSKAISKAKSKVGNLEGVVEVKTLSASGISAKYNPIFKVEDRNVSKKLKIDHSRMPVLLIGTATTWARKIKYNYSILQNKFEQDSKFYIIPSSVSSMGLERFNMSFDNGSEYGYRGKAYKDIFARTKEKDVINTLIQLENSAIEGSNDSYEFMRDVYKLVQTAKAYSEKNPQVDETKNIHKDTYTYVYIPDTVLNYDDSQTQKIYWLNLFNAGIDDADSVTKDELENMKTKDIEVTWQVLEYEKYDECRSGDGKIKVYALSPFGSTYARAYYQYEYSKSVDNVIRRIYRSRWSFRLRLGRQKKSRVYI